VSLFLCFDYVLVNDNYFMIGISVGRGYIWRSPAVGVLLVGIVFLAGLEDLGAGKRHADGWPSVVLCSGPTSFVVLKDTGTIV